MAEGCKGGSRAAVASWALFPESRTQEDKVAHEALEVNAPACRTPTSPWPPQPPPVHAWPLISKAVRRGGPSVKGKIFPLTVSVLTVTDRKFELLQKRALEGPDRSTAGHGRVRDDPENLMFYIDTRLTKAGRFLLTSPRWWNPLLLQVQLQRRWARVPEGGGAMGAMPSRYFWANVS